MRRRGASGQTRRRVWRRWGIGLLLASMMVGGVGQTRGQSRLTSPQEEFGFSIGDDYQLVNYSRYEAYLKKLARQSDRLSIVEMGRSAEGRTMWLAIVTSPRNQAKLPR